MSRVKTRYTPPKHYTAEELRATLILDLESDLAFSQRTNPPTPEWVTYQEGIVAALANLRAGGEDTRL